jgi:hypothetical protein
MMNRQRAAKASLPNAVAFHFCASIVLAALETEKFLDRHAWLLP